MIEIAGKSYDVPVPSGMRSFALQQRIIPVAGRLASAIAELLGSGVGNLGDLEVEKVLPMALPRIGAVFSEMSDGELEAITRELLKGAKVGKMDLFGGPAGDLFDAEFRGRTLDVWKLLWHALEVWYPDFFVRARGLFAKANQVSPSEASSTLPGVGLAPVSSSATGAA